MNIPIADVGYAILGTLCLMGFIVAILSKLGLLSFGKAAAASCDDCAARIFAGAKEAQRVLASRIDRMETDHASIWNKLNKISDDVSYIRGWIEHNGNHK